MVVEWLIKVLEATMNLKTSLMERRLKGQYTDFEREYKQIYLSIPLGDDEDEETLRNGFPKDKEDVEQFPREFLDRRLHLREYLKELYLAIRDLF